MSKRRGHGEGSIHQRGDGRWCAVIDLGFVNGKRRRKQIYGKTRKEVAEKLKAIHRDQAAGINLTPEVYTVEQFMKRWLDEVICHRAPRTIESYTGVAKNHIYPYVGSHRLQKLRPEHVQAMANALIAKKLSARSAEYACLILSRALNQAKRWGYVSQNVVDLVELPKVRKKKLVPAGEEQAKAFLESVKGHRLEALFWVALMLGLRRGEVLGLLKKNIDFEAKTVRIEASLQRVGKELVRSYTKTESSQRTLPLPDPIIRVLREHLARMEAERQKAGADNWVETDYVFVSERGTPLEPRNVLRAFKEALKKAELPEMRFHDLRHWCASLLIAYGVHPKSIQEILGHANITTTLDVYGHLLPNVLRDAVQTMGGLGDQKRRVESEQ